MSRGFFRGARGGGRGGWFLFFGFSKYAHGSLIGPPRGGGRGGFTRDAGPPDSVLGKYILIFTMHFKPLIRVRNGCLHSCR